MIVNIENEEGVDVARLIENAFAADSIAAIMALSKIVLEVGVMHLTVYDEFNTWIAEVSKMSPEAMVPYIKKLGGIK
jgi:uncharacterized radical SAM superfamily Fe-S cluster-containing enzyme